MGVSDYSTTPASNTAINGIEVSNNNAPSAMNDAVRQLMADVKGLVAVQTKSATYTVAASDLANLINVTSAVTINLTAAATLGANFYCAIKAVGVAVTIDPNGAETIDSAATLSLASGEWVMLYCDGTSFTTLGSSTLSIGSDVQAWNQKLDDISGLAVTDGNIIVADGTNFVAESGATARASLGLTIGSDVQAHGDVLDDLNTLGANSADSEFLVGTGAGALAWESGATARTSMGVAIGSDVQAHGAVLDDLNTLGAPTTDGEFVVATGSGAFAYETGDTARTSLGVGTGDSPTFAAVTSTGDATVNGLTVGRGLGGVSTDTAVGSSALSSTVSGGSNVAIGNSALDGLTTGDSNVAIGASAMTGATVGARYNTAIGVLALGSMADVNHNMAIGYLAGRYMSGNGNVAIGNYVLDASSNSGTDNTAVGFSSMSVNTTGAKNTAVGRDTLAANTSGGQNTALGYGSGSTITTGTYNSCIGHNAEPTSATATGEFTLGDTNVTSLRCNDASISTLSDKRDKFIKGQSDLGLGLVNKIDVVDFEWKTRDGNIKDGTREIGFIAQQLLEALGDDDDLDIVNQSNPDKLEVKHTKLLPIALRAIQELSAKVEELEQKVNKKPKTKK